MAAENTAAEAGRTAAAVEAAEAEPVAVAAYVELHESQHYGRTTQKNHRPLQPPP